MYGGPGITYSDRWVFRVAEQAFDEMLSVVTRSARTDQSFCSSRLAMKPARVIPTLEEKGVTTVGSM